MPCYLICDVTVHDRGALAEYLARAKGTVEQFGGRYLAQAGKIDQIEGDWEPRTIIVVEFPSRKHAHDWYGSKAYAPALAVNANAMTRNMIVVDGL